MHPNLGEGPMDLVEQGPIPVDDLDLHLTQLHRCAVGLRCRDQVVVDSGHDSAVGSVEVARSSGGGHRDPRGQCATGGDGRQQPRQRDGDTDPATRCAPDLHLGVLAHGQRQVPTRVGVSCAAAERDLCRSQGEVVGVEVRRLQLSDVRHGNRRDAASGQVGQLGIGADVIRALGLVADVCHGVSMPGEGEQERSDLELVRLGRAQLPRRRPDESTMRAGR